MTLAQFCWVGIGVIIAILALFRFLKGFQGWDFKKLASGPMALQQKRAWLGLIIGLLMSVAILAIFIIKGPTNYFEDRKMRLFVFACFLGGLACYLIMLSLTRCKPGQIDMDERDQMIMARAPSVQMGAVLITLALWAIVLTEIYWEQKVISLVYPWLIFMSSFIISVLAFSVGILLGYARKETFYGEG